MAIPKGAYIANKHSKIAKKCVMLLAVVLGIIGVICLACATLISTVTIQAIDKELSEMYESINEFNFYTIMSFMGISEFNQAYTHKLILCFESDLLNQLKPEAVEEKEELLCKALTEIVRCTGGWSGLFNEEIAQKLTANEKIKNILYDKNLSTLTKINKIEELGEEHKESAKKRIKPKIEKFVKNKKLMKEIEEKKLFWHNIFKGFQIAGLVFITFAGIFDGIIKMKTLNNT